MIVFRLLLRFISSRYIEGFRLSITAAPYRGQPLLIFVWWRCYALPDVGTYVPPKGYFDACRYSVSRRNSPRSCGYALPLIGCALQGARFYRHAACATRSPSPPTTLFLGTLALLVAMPPLTSVSNTIGWPSLITLCLSGALPPSTPARL